MEVAPVDQRQPDLRIDAEAARRVQPGEAATDDRDAVRESGDVPHGAHAPILASRRDPLSDHVVGELGEPARHDTDPGDA